ncbi:MAG TPA: hypothetical protein VIV60_31765 [Polyangiaceae bacterium]
MLPETYQFQGPSYLRGCAEGEARGKAEGILTILDARGLTVSAEQRHLILECSDLNVLSAWLRKAVTVDDLTKLFAQ